MRKHLSRILGAVVLVLLVGFLTLLTQVGGLVLVISVPVFRYISLRFHGKWLQLAMKATSFLILYLTVTLLVVPMIARAFGRVPLPILGHQNVKPANMLTGLLNRNYVRVDMRDALYGTANELAARYPTAKINYLDANFPFGRNFPLLPHLSHNDGRKLDLSFQYNDARSGNIIASVPSWIGYGICEEPRPEEVNTPESCDQQGYWQYSLLTKLVPQTSKSKFEFSNERTKYLVELLL